MAFFKRNDGNDFLVKTIKSSLVKFKVEDMMIERAIDLISKVMSKTKFEVYRMNKSAGKVMKTIDPVHYLLNLKPNQNEDGSSFWKMVISWLLRNGECLIVVIDGKMYMASYWDASEKVLVEKTYKNITIMDTRGNTYDLEDSFSESEVIYMNLGDNKAVKLLSTFYEEYDDVIAVSFSAYKNSNSIKRVLNYPGKTPLFKKPDGSEISIDAYAKELTKGVFEEGNSITTLPDGFSLDDIKQNVQSPDNFKSAIKEFGDKVANAFGIPLDIYYGTKTDKSTGTSDFITFAVLHPMSVVEDAINTYNVTKEQYFKGERVRYKRFSIKHFDIVDVAGSLDKLFSIGWSHNNILSILDEPEIDEEWANRHYVTKNYMDVHRNFEDGEGGE